MSAGKLPEGWISAPVSTVTTLIRGVTYKKDQAINYLKDDYLPLIRANNIQNGKFDTTDLVFVPKNLVKESQKISPEDIVIAMSSGSKSVVGKSAHQHLPFECSFGAFCGVLRPEKLIFSGFIAHFTKSSLYRNKISSLSAGANINNIKPASFDLINIPIPPLSEQKIIAEKLDTLLAQVDSTKARLEQIPQILKRFRQAVLSKAIAGDLTENWRVKNNITNNSLKMRLEQISTNDKYSFGIGPFGSNLKVEDYKNEGHPLIFVRDIRACNFSNKNTKYIDSSKFEELKAHRAKPGDLLITKMGDPPGDVAIYPKHCQEAVITADCIKLRVNEECCLSKFILLTMMSNEFRGKVVEISAGVAQQKVNLKNFKKLEVNIPSIVEQAEIVRRVEQLFAYADTIEKQVNNALARVNNLTQSILAKAFRGELTAQWRAENPELISGENSAAALLEKIKAERAASGGKKASRKKS